MEQLDLIIQKAKAFRDKLRGLSRLQKVVLIVLIAAVPAGIALASLLFLRWKAGSK